MVTTIKEYFGFQSSKTQGKNPKEKLETKLQEPEKRQYNTWFPWILKLLKGSVLFASFIKPKIIWIKWTNSYYWMQRCCLKEKESWRAIIKTIQVEGPLIYIEMICYYCINDVISLSSHNTNPVKCLAGDERKAVTQVNMYSFIPLLEESLNIQFIAPSLPSLG